MAEQQQDKLWENCSSGRLEEVREELEAGADPNTTGYDNSTLLMEAAGGWHRNHSELVGLLLSSPGIQVNAKNRRNETTLHLACKFGPPAILSKLLACNGLLLNETDNSG